MTMLSDFMKEHGLTPEAISAASAAIEQHNPKTRDQAKARETARREKKAYDEAGADKPPRYGRGVSSDTLQRAMAGQALPRIARKKVVRAVNSALASQKKDAIEWRQLFGDAKRKVGKAPTKKK